LKIRKNHPYPSLKIRRGVSAVLMEEVFPRSCVVISAYYCKEKLKGMLAEEKFALDFGLFGEKEQLVYLNKGRILI
jgi:hypothetical protein